MTIPLPQPCNFLDYFVIYGFAVCLLAVPESVIHVVYDLVPKPHFTICLHWPLLGYYFCESCNADDMMVYKLICERANMMEYDVEEKYWLVKKKSNMKQEEDSNLQMWHKCHACEGGVRRWDQLDQFQTSPGQRNVGQAQVGHAVNAVHWQSPTEDSTSPNLVELFSERSQRKLRLIRNAVWNLSSRGGTTR